MDPFLAMMGQVPDEKQAALMAQMLRGQSGLGGRLSTSTIQPVQRQGLAMQDMAQSQAQSVGQAKYRNDLIEEQAKAREARVLTSALSAANNQKPQYKLSDSAAKSFRERVETLGTINTLSQRFRDEFSGSVPMLGEVENWVANKGLGTEGMKAQSQWWGDWKKFYENIERNRLFGSALTDSEQRQWKASNITPDMSPEQIRSRLRILDLLNKKMAAYEANDLALRGHEDYAREMTTAIGTLPPEAFEDLSGYMQQVEEELQKRRYPHAELDDLSLEELIRMREEL